MHFQFRKTISRLWNVEIRWFYRRSCMVAFAWNMCARIEIVNANWYWVVINHCDAVEASSNLNINYFTKSDCNKSSSQPRLRKRTHRKENECNWIWLNFASVWSIEIYSNGNIFVKNWVCRHIVDRARSDGTAAKKQQQSTKWMDKLVAFLLSLLIFECNGRNCEQKVAEQRRQMKPMFL